MAEKTLMPGVSGTLFDDLWNKALGVFDKVADLEVTKRYLSLAQDQRAAEAAYDAARAPAGASLWSNPDGKTAPWVWVAGAGAVALIGGYLIFKR